MKNIYYSLFIIAIAIFTSCKSSPDSKIIGTWKIDNAEIVNVADLVNKMVTEANIPDSLVAQKDSVKAIAEERYAKMVESLKQVEVVFKEDKTLSFNGLKGERKGTWALSEDAKSLNTIMEGGGDAVHNFESFTEKNIVATIESDGEITKYSMTKVK